METSASIWEGTCHPLWGDEEALSDASLGWGRRKKLLTEEAPGGWGWALGPEKGGGARPQV